MKGGGEGEGDGWRGEVMRRCKEQLVEQRAILKEEAKQIEGQFETLQGLSEQINKAVTINSDGHKK